MKTLTVVFRLLIPVWVAVATIMTHAQVIDPSPEPGQPCAPVEYPSVARPYLFCNGEGEILPLCTSNPFNPRGGANWTLSPVKAPMPICLQYIPSAEHTVVHGDVCGDENGCRILPVFNAADIPNDIQRALNQWNCVCGKQNDPCGCTMNIMFVTDPEIFKDPKGSGHGFGANYIEKNPGTNDFERSLNPSSTSYDNTTGMLNSNCELDCSKITFYLNHTEAYIAFLYDL